MTQLGECAEATCQLGDGAGRCQGLEVFAPCAARRAELVAGVVEFAVEPAAAVAPVLFVQRGQADVPREEGVVIERKTDRREIAGNGTAAQQHAGMGLVVAGIAVEVLENAVLAVPLHGALLHK